MLAFGAANALAAPPTAITETPESKTAKNGIFKGSINPNGLPTTYYWEYGTTTSYGSKYPVPAELSAGEGTEPVKKALGPVSILENTIYHVRLVAKNKDGTSFGEDKVFKSWEYIPSWKLQTIPNFKESSSNRLKDVSCVSGGECIAIGESTNAPSGAVSSRSARWNGAEWTLVTGGVYGLGLVESVSCTSITACTTVGTNQVSKQPIAARWEGTSWKAQTVPMPGGATKAELFGVSCVSASECIAVGSASTGPLAERWNGTEWAVQKITGATGMLKDVSCVSASSCMAVGQSSEGLPVSLTWNGAEWKTQKVPSTPAGMLWYFLDSVSCTASNACTAVGSGLTSGGTYVPLAARWNGTGWSIQEVPLAVGTKNSKFTSVSCASTLVCVGTGWYENAEGLTRTLTERWNGISWGVQSSPNPAGGTANILYGVSCISPAICESVGSYKEAGGITSMFGERAS
jgi:hypothetical protein